MGLAGEVPSRGAGPNGGNEVPAWLGDFLAGGEGEGPAGPSAGGPGESGLTASAHPERRPPPVQLSLYF